MKIKFAMYFNKLYTIIIPHRDIPHLLQRCLDSIPPREDVQIIVIDDNSSPEVVNFTHFPGSDRKDVEVIYTKEGRGAGYARNCGLAKAKGQWLLFADADDFFLPDFWTVLDGYSSSDYELITFRATSADSDTLAPLPSRQNYHSEISEEMDLDLLKFRNDVPWAKMISHRLVQRYQIKFDETPAANDVMFSAYVDFYAQNVTTCAKDIYCATVRSGSLKFGIVLCNLLARVSVACRYNRFLRKIGRKDKYLYSYALVKQCERSYGKTGYYKALWIYLRTECTENIYKTFYDILKDKILLWKQRDIKQ